jgi:hypothetical protein
MNRGLVIDYTGHVDTMLSRTADALPVQRQVALTPMPATCSSAHPTLTHEAVAADASNISMCPYLVFAYETTAEPGKVVIGFRPPDLRNDDASKAVKTEGREAAGRNRQ